MAVETANGGSDVIHLPNGVANGDWHPNAGAPASGKKSREIERRRRRRKQKKKSESNGNNKSEKHSRTATDDVDSDGAGDGKENADPQQVVEKVEVEYVPEKPEIEDELLEDFKNIFEKFKFTDITAGAEGGDKQDEAAANATSNKKVDSDDEDEEQDTQQKETGLSNKKKKLQRRMKIAELKQICSRPDVVEVWDATAADPKLLVFLKSYRNTVPVPRHWCQKRKFLQGPAVPSWSQHLSVFAKGNP